MLAAALGEVGEPQQLPGGGQHLVGHALFWGIALRLHAIKERVGAVGACVENAKATVLSQSSSIRQIKNGIEQAE